jgi:ribose 5-phosphate isomerase A
MLCTEMDPKQRVALAALELIRDDTVVGLGTGSTAKLFIDALGAALRDGKLRGLRAIATSEASERQARGLGIPIVSFAHVSVLDITIDGADEIAPDLSLIKGLGGALLREKLVAQNSRRMIVIADAGKLVRKLGTKAPLPVEVAPFQHEVHERFLRTLGCEPNLRRTDDGKELVTDNGNLIYDCRFSGGIDSPQSIEQTIRSRAGLLETGLFIDIAERAIVADGDDVRVITR